MKACGLPCNPMPMRIDNRCFRRSKSTENAAVAGEWRKKHAFTWSLRKERDLSCTKRPKQRVLRPIIVCLEQSD